MDFGDTNASQGTGEEPASDRGTQTWSAIRLVSLHGWPAYALAIAAATLATSIRFLIDPVAGGQSPFATYFMASIVVFQLSGLGPAVVELALGSLLGNWLFIEPRGSFSLAASGLTGMALYLMVGGATLLLFRSLREARRVAEHRQKKLFAAESAMRAQRELWRVTLASVAEALIATDRDGRVTFVNGMAERLTGVSAAEAVGRPLAEVVRLAGRGGECPSDTLDHVLREGEVFGPVEDVALGDRPGAGLSVEVVGSPIRDDSGRVLGSVVVVRDVTLAKQTARELVEAKEVAEAANRSKDRFFAAMGHELRTPLTPVLLAVTYLIEGGEAPEAIRPTLEMIRRNVEVEARLIDDLLDVVQIHRGTLTGSPRLVDAHALIRQAVDHCRPELDAAGIVPWLGLDAETWHVMADPRRLRQAVANLIRNAVKFSPRGGHVAIRTSAEPSADGGRWVVEVADAGIGIAPEALAMIFNAFDQGRTSSAPRHGGLGLGLTICHAIVAGSGGDIEAESPGPGLGSTFRIRMAAQPAPGLNKTSPPPASLRLDVPDRARTRAPLRILVVEDDEPTRQAVAQVVRGLGHQVTTADSVASALIAADAPIDLLIIDIGLPDGSGHDLLRRLRSRRHIEAIALTGFGLDDDIRRSDAVGFAEHLTKPIDIRTLETAIRRMASLRHGEANQADAKRASGA